MRQLSSGQQPLPYRLNYAAFASASQRDAALLRYSLLRCSLPRYTLSCCGD